jgi:hypothetical protein
MIPVIDELVPKPGWLSSGWLEQALEKPVQGPVFL